MLELLVIVAVLIEAIIEAFVIATSGEMNKKQIISFFVGGILLFMFGIDVLTFLGLEFAEVVPLWLGSIVSALIGAVLIFRFSGNFNDLFDWINGLRQP